MSEALQRMVLDEPRLEVRAKADKTTEIFGYGLVFNSLSVDLGGFREIIRASAVDETLASGRDLSAQIQHNGGITTIGRTSNGTLEVGKDDTGVWYVITPPDTNAGRDIVALVRDGYINKSSFSFSVKPGGELWHWEGDVPIRELLNIDIYEMGPVDGPAYEATTAEIRSAGLQSFEAARSAFEQAKAAAYEPQPSEHQKILRELNARLAKEGMQALYP